jgi:hypothetical protein
MRVFVCSLHSILFKFAADTASEMYRGMEGAMKAAGTNAASPPVTLDATSS